MPFFVRKTTNKRPARKEKKGRKSVKGAAADGDRPPPGKRARPAPIAEAEDEEIDSDEIDDEDLVPGKVQPDQLSGSEEEEETAQDKRLRLAKLYLEEIEKQEQSRAETEDLDAARRSVSDRLRDDVLERAGRLQRAVADSYLRPDQEHIQTLRCRAHRRPITCVLLSPDDKHLFTASKDCAIVKWCMETFQRLKVVPGARKKSEGAQDGHTGHILAMAISSDNKYMASGDTDRLILLWDPAGMTRLHVFRGHRGPVSGLAFQRGTHQLFSAAHDRMVKVWSVDDRSYIETLFGHQDAITGLDALSRERAVTCGGRDNSVRLWKLVEESQLVFNGHRASIDCIKLINEQHFVTGGEDGLLCVWGIMKKRPLCSVPNAHGVDPGNGQPRWVSAVSALVNADLLASGSWDGQVRLWRCAPGFVSVSKLLTVAIDGFVNSLTFSSDGARLVIGTGQEHRLGRWWRLPEAKNQTVVVPFIRKPT